MFDSFQITIFVGFLKQRLKHHCLKKTQVEVQKEANCQVYWQHAKVLYKNQTLSEPDSMSQNNGIHVEFTSFILSVVSSMLLGLIKLDNSNKRYIERGSC